MKNFKLKLITAASAMVMLGAAGGAQAGSYALAANNIQDFSIATTNVTFFASVDTTSASATLNGASTINAGNDPDVQVANAPGSNPVVANNAAFAGGVITPVGMTATNYSYADALIQKFGAGGTTPPFDAYVIAESHLRDAGSASGETTNRSATGFTAQFVAGVGATLDFSFTADPLIRTFLQPVTGLFANGTLGATLTITCNQAQCGTRANGNPITQGQIVFSWAPDGSADGAAGVTGAIGGNELADAENLNLSLSNFTPGASNYSDAAAFGSYRAVTNELAAGNYTLTLAMNATDSTLKAVPEPGSIALLGLGLGGLGFLSRRRQRKV